MFIEQRTERLESPGQPLVFDLRFEPLRPFKTQTEFIIYKSCSDIPDQLQFMSKLLHMVNKKQTKKKKDDFDFKISTNYGKNDR